MEEGPWVQRELYCELKDADLQWPQWDTLLADGVVLDCKAIAPSDVKKHLLKNAKLGQWR